MTSNHEKLTEPSPSAIEAGAASPTPAAVKKGSVASGATASAAFIVALRLSGAFSPVYTPGELARAYASVRAEMNALPADEVGRVNVHVRTVVLIVLGVLPTVDAFLEELIEKLPMHDIEQLSKLRTYALALLYAYTRTQPAAAAETSVQAVLVEALPLRERLLGLAEGYASYGLLDVERVANIRRGTGHVDAAHDLIALAELFRDEAAGLEGRTPVTAAELDRAEALGMQMLFALGQRTVGTDGAGTAEAHDDDYARAFRLMIRAYDQYRRAMAYLRWSEGDAAKLAPSLFARRRTRGATPPDGTNGDGGGGGSNGGAGGNGGDTPPAGGGEAGEGTEPALAAPPFDVAPT